MRLPAEELVEAGDLAGGVTVTNADIHSAFRLQHLQTEDGMQQNDRLDDGCRDPIGRVDGRVQCGPARGASEVLEGRQPCRLRSVPDGQTGRGRKALS